jgi:hypothetical protein
MPNLAVLFFSLASLAAAPKEPPKIYIDKGACPFECCTYREWCVTKNTPLYSAVEGKNVVGEAKAGTKVNALTGEVHVIPAKVTVKTEHGTYHPGEIFYVLTYEGEGSYKVWRNGEVTSDGDVYELFDNGSPKLRQHWGESKSKPQSTWWVKIKLRDGKEGWTKETDHFGNMDACG